jgi:Uncharacterized protein conserved in bacteria (DUF2188)
MPGKNLHVIPHEKKWAVKDEGSERIRSVYESKQDAIDAARDLARSRNASFLVYGRDGQLLLKTEAPSSISDDEIREVVRRGTLENWERGSSDEKRVPRG